jgi:hypothetical protein
MNPSLAEFPHDFLVRNAHRRIRARCIDAGEHFRLNP